MAEIVYGKVHIYREFVYPIKRGKQWKSKIAQRRQVLGFNTLNDICENYKPKVVS